jgi:hypothetical protein
MALKSGACSSSPKNGILPKKYLKFLEKEFGIPEKEFTIPQKGIRDV